MSYKKEYAWINKKYRQGVSKSELLNSVGIFSNKDKKKVMSQKKLSSKDYEKRKSFLFNVYSILTGSVKKSKHKNKNNTKGKMKVYGANETHYGGYLILKDKNNIKSKHYISAVDPSFPNGDKNVRVWVRSSGGDIDIPYKMGSSKSADIGIRTWVKNRKKQGMHVSSNLPNECFKRK